MYTHVIIFIYIFFILLIICNEKLELYKITIEMKLLFELFENMPTFSA